MSTSTSELQKQLRDLVATGKTEKTIQELRTLCEQAEYTHLNDWVVQQSAAWQKLRSDKIKGILGTSKEMRKTSKINEEVLQIIHWLGLPAVEFEQKKAKKSKSGGQVEVTGNENTVIRDVHNSSISIHHHHYPTNEES